MRALKWDDSARDIYEGLPDHDKLAFKEAWVASDKEFEFTRVTKSHTVSHTKMTSMNGKMMTVFRVAVELGGWNIAACREGAVQYCKMCQRVDPVSLTSDKSWTGIKMYMFFEHLVSNTNTQDWRKTVENLTTERNPEWQNKCDLNKAKIAFAAASGKKVARFRFCLLYTSPSPRDQRGSRMPSSA